MKEKKPVNSPHTARTRSKNSLTHCLHRISAVFSSFPEQNSTRTMRTAMNIRIARYLGPRSRSYNRWSLVTWGCSTVSHPPACVRCISILVVSHPACKKSPGKKENAMCTLCYKILVKQVKKTNALRTLKCDFCLMLSMFELRIDYMEHHQISWPTLRVNPVSWNMPLRECRATPREGCATLTNPTTPGPAHHPSQPTCTAHTLRNSHKCFKRLMQAFPVHNRHPSRESDGINSQHCPCCQPRAL